MRAHEFMLLERFHDTGWLLDSIYHCVNTIKINKRFDPVRYYTSILTYIIERPEFKKISNGISVIPKVVVDKGIVNSTDYIISAGLRADTFKNFVDYLRWNDKVYYIEFKMVVSKFQPINRNTLIADLDSTIGHELEHLIQRLHRLQDGHHTPGYLKKSYKNLVGGDAAVDYENTINYINVKKSLNTEMQYYLRHGELLSHAHSIAAYLFSDSGSNSLRVLPILYRLGWTNRLHNAPISYKAKFFLNKYASILNNAENRQIIPDGKKMWKKLFKEIYCVLKDKSTL